MHPLQSVWGYDEEFMHACRGELTLTASIMRSSSVKVAEINGHLVGVTQVTVKENLLNSTSYLSSQPVFAPARERRCLTGLDRRP